MPNYTGNYNLTKPLQNELYDIDIQNGNMDTLDTNLKSVSDVADIAKAQSDTNADNLQKLKEFEKQPFDESGNLVSIQNFEGMPLNCVTAIEPIQEGSGDPSPDNVRTISGWTGAKLTRCGKNLLPPAVEKTITSNGVTFTSDGQGRYTINGTATGANAGVVIDLVKPITIGKVAQYCHLLNPVANVNISFSFIRPNGTQITWMTTSSVNRIMQLQELAGETISKINLFLMKDNTANNFTLTPMFCTDDVPADFAHYQGDTYTADFGQTVYGGTLDWNTGVLTVEWAMITLTGNETWDAYGSSGAFLLSILTDAVTPNYTEIPKMVCSHYATQTRSDIASGTNVGVGIGSATHLIVYPGSGYTADTFKSYIDAQYAAGTPVQVCYKLATPQTIQLTPQEILALTGVNNIWSDAGETTVSGRTDILWLTSNLIKRVKKLESTVAALEAAAVSE